jgi:hypothetical protein
MQNNTLGAGPKDSLTWLMLTVASMIGAVLVMTIGAILLALLLANVSDQLTRDVAHHGGYRDY